MVVRGDHRGHRAPGARHHFDLLGFEDQIADGEDQALRPEEHAAAGPLGAQVGVAARIGDRGDLDADDRMGGVDQVLELGGIIGRGRTRRHGGRGSDGGERGDAEASDPRRQS